MMNKEFLNAKGCFSLAVIDVASGKIIDDYQENNLVVTLGHTNIARLLGGDTTGKKITKLQLGTNGTAPALTDVAITAPFETTITGVTYPEPNSVKFDWALNATEGNGQTFREFGLVTDSGALFARKTRTEIVKTDAVRLVGSWKITINS
ncbi:MAG: hypothetical protein J7577_13245 [Sphingobacteriaceae bacterium]|nr:hypothetical protein [Sphingobacteriaceae bacterium]